MTSKITVTAHDWPIRVITEQRLGENFHAVGEKIVPPHTVEDFYLTDSQGLSQRELPMPKKEEVPAIDQQAPKVPLGKTLADAGLSVRKNDGNDKIDA